ncbi:DUF3486 family protein [Roseospira marina]|uniref:DUF3486 family protein n=1 Tax=Roseospira marina TaxID=140057 RepID=A0A5M6I6N1_9PROT|nr:phage protein Gp27 family protein [Roseospira marina]KAA5603763.1 DUF3486 family protein [Roseospira marina]MBB4316046.1 hypothetical protein [Roseospira marina]MBB5089236.1 hypothetical protein [Roseospira marina]
MGRKSRIDTELSPEDLSEFRRLLVAGRLTIDELTDWLEARGYEISRSAVGRAAKRQALMAARLRESRAITEGLVQELGDAATQGQQGRLLVEVSRSLVFDFLTQVQDAGGDGAALDPKDVMMLGKGLAELAKAARLDQDFEEKVEVRARTLAAEMAAKAIDNAAAEAQAAGEQGLSADRLAALRRGILGVSR